MSIHDMHWPNEDVAYRTARDELLKAEIELRGRIEEVAAMRRALPLGGRAEEYLFDCASGTVGLSELFEGGKTSLVLYSYMLGPDDEAPCPMCTTYLDGADAYAPHIQRRINFAVVARSPLERLNQLAQQRGWRNLKLLSAAGNRYAQDYHSETPDGSQLPMCNVFVKRKDGVYHFWASEMLFAPSSWHPRHIDMLWPIWHYFDLTPEGRGDFAPAVTYPED